MAIKLCLISPMGGGKDTMAKILIDEFGFTRMAYADELRRIANELYPQQMTEHPRETLQWLGATMRELDKDVWINRLDFKMKEYSAKYVLQYGTEPNIVITDCRYPNELEHLKSIGFTAVQILVPYWVLVRRNQHRKDRVFSLEQLEHESESMALKERVGDIYLYNSGTMEEFVDSIRVMMKGCVLNER